MTATKVTLKRIGKAAFSATNESGQSFVLDGMPKIGGEDRGMRPMQAFLASLAGCSAMDVVMILDQQRQGLEDLDIEVSGTRVDAVPAVYDHIHLAYRASGDVAPKKLERAVRLAVEKYCSVSKMLLPEVRVTWEATLRSPGVSA